MGRAVASSLWTGLTIALRMLICSFKQTAILNHFGVGMDTASHLCESLCRDILKQANKQDEESDGWNCFAFVIDCSAKVKLQIRIPSPLTFDLLRRVVHHCPVVHYFRFLERILIRNSIMLHIRVQPS